VSAQPLPGILASLAPVLDHYGYVAVGGFILLEDFGIPLPGETILIAAAVYAGSGRLSVVAVGLVALVAAIIGDNIGYAIGYFGGRALVLRFGKYVHLTSERLGRAEGFFDRYGGAVVAGARFVEGLRQANGIVAGTIRMHWLKFLAFNALGAALWVTVWVSIGYLAGSHITVIYDTITRYALYLLIALAVLVAALAVRAVVRRRARRNAGDTGDTGQTLSTGDATDTVDTAKTEDTGDAGNAADASQLADASVAGPLANFVVNDVDLTAIVAADVDQQHPERVQLQEMQTADDYRAMWGTIERLWSDTVARAERLPADALHERVGDEWSFLETMRHLIFITDSWVSRTIRDEPMPYHPFGLPQIAYAPPYAASLGIDLAARPTSAEVMAVRAGRMAMVRDIVDGLDETELGRKCTRSPAPGYPDEARTVGHCLAVVMAEETEHHRFAVGHLAVLAPTLDEPD
jgi:membrane protein DedA with SNARE-associated domain